MIVLAPVAPQYFSEETGNILFIRGIKSAEEYILAPGHLSGVNVRTGTVC